MKNNFILSLFLIIISLAIGFYGGIIYQKSKRPAGFSDQIRQFGQRQQNQRFGGMRPINGEIIKKDKDSLTVKLRDGSTKIVFFTEKTKIFKSTQGSKDDLKEKETVFIIGQENSDGSITAENVQIGRLGFERRGN